MSSSVASHSTPQTALDWGLIGRQITGILRMEVKRQLVSRRALSLYFLAFAPPLIMALWAMSPIPKKIGLTGPVDILDTFSFFYFGYLTTSIFLSALVMFMSLFRDEILEKSLHYYFLAPIRREVLVAGKFLSALVACAGTFMIGTAALYVFAMSPWGLGPLSRHLFSGPGLGHVFAYMGISVLACLGYGALFQLAGQLFKNPVVIAVAIGGWEFLNPFLPSFLKKLSVIFYLKSMFPIPVTEGPFTILAEPTPAWISIPGLLIFTALVLAAAGWRARAMEIHYGADD